MNIRLISCSGFSLSERQRHLVVDISYFMQINRLMNSSCVCAPSFHICRICSEGCFKCQVTLQSCSSTGCHRGSALYEWSPLDTYLSLPAKSVVWVTEYLLQNSDKQGNIMHRRISEDMKDYSDRHLYGVESITNSSSLLKDLQLLWESSVPEICFLHLFLAPTLILSSLTWKPVHLKASY